MSPTTRPRPARHAAQLMLTFRRHERPLYEALQRYAAGETNDNLQEAIKQLCIQGLRMPTIVGAPPPRLNPIDLFLDPVLPKVRHAEKDEADIMVREAERIHGEPPPPPPAAEELPLLGYPEVDTLLTAYYKDKRRAVQVAAKAGRLDTVFDGLEAVVVPKAEPEPQPAPVAADDAPPYDIEASPVDTEPVIARDPESGAVVEIIPQRLLSDDAMDDIDAQLRAVERTTREVAEIPQNDVLAAFAIAQNIRR